MANRIVLWKPLASHPGVKFVVGDTLAGLPEPSEAGPFAYAIDVENLCFYDGVDWVQTGTGSGPGGTSNNYFPAGWS